MRNGKGSARRPARVSSDEYEANYDRIFGTNQKWAFAQTAYDDFWRPAESFTRVGVMEEARACFDSDVFALCRREPVEPRTCLPTVDDIVDWMSDFAADEFYQDGKFELTDTGRTILDAFLPKWADKYVRSHTWLPVDVEEHPRKGATVLSLASQCGVLIDPHAVIDWGDMCAWIHSRRMVTSERHRMWAEHRFGIGVIDRKGEGAPRGVVMIQPDGRPITRVEAVAHGVLSIHDEMEAWLRP